jgi:hypothetical protein
LPTQPLLLAQAHFAARKKGAYACKFRAADAAIANEHRIDVRGARPERLPTHSTGAI